MMREALDTLEPIPHAWQLALRRLQLPKPMQQRRRKLQAALTLPVVTRVAPPALSASPAHPVSWAGLLAPSDVEQLGRNMLRVGDSYVITLEARVWPPHLCFGWLDDPVLGLDMPGIALHQAIVPIPDGLAQQLLTSSENAARTTLAGDALANVAEDVHATHGGRAAAELRLALAAGNERLFQISFGITVAGVSVDHVREQVAALRRAAAQIGLGLQVAHNLQWEGYLQSLPLAVQHGLLVHDWHGAAVAQCLPPGHTTPQHKGGRPFVWGEHPRRGVPVLWDRWQAVNPHALVIAESGNGKTYAMSGYLAQDVALGEDAVLVLDPKHQEYRPLVEALGGTYVSLARHAPIHINPLELPQITTERRAVIERLQIDLLGERISFARTLIVGAFRAQHTVVDASAIVLLETALHDAYHACDISSDPATFDQPMPTFSDVQTALQRIAAAADDDDVRNEARALARAMTLFTGGTIGTLFNAPSNIPTTNPLLAIDVSALLNADDELLGLIIPVIVADFFKTIALNRPAGRRYHLVLDEAHALLHSEAGARTIDMMYRVGRALGFAVTVITQALDDLHPSAQTQTLIDNAPTKLILGLNRDSNAVDRAAAVLHLNEAEHAYVAQCRLQPGVGASALLLADGQRTPLLIPPWPPSLHQVITGKGATDGATP